MNRKLKCCHPVVLSLKLMPVIWDVDRNSEFVCLNPFLAIVSCKYCRQISGLGTPWQTKSTVNRFSYSFAKKALNLLFDRECPKRAPDGRIPEILSPAGKCGRYGFAHTCCPAWPRVLRAFRYRRVLQPNSRRTGTENHAVLLNDLFRYMGEDTSRRTL